MSLQGTVLDNLNLPLEGAHIYIKENNKFVFAGTSNKDGFFSVGKDYTPNNLPTIKITFIGFKDVIHNGIAGSLTIMQEKSEELETVTVIGQKSITPITPKKNINKVFIFDLIVAIIVISSAVYFYSIKK
tara:strand:+ start:250 stop:639 length:390 start_codon:yes stop_codon:yes gene_type:complete